MSVTHPSHALPAERKEFLAGHDQLKPFLLALAIFVVSGVVALAITGLPS
jgi:hypothetical protein